MASIPHPNASIAKPIAIPTLTGLRFIAAFSVLLAHSMHWIAPISTDHYLIRKIGESSAIGMPLFFVLSGFVIHYNYSHYFNRTSLAAFMRFMIARFSRLYPLYILVLLFYFHQRHIHFWYAANILRYFTLTQAWQFLYKDSTWVGHLYLAPAWSISVEWFLYIFYALVGIYLLRFKTVYRCLFAACILIAIYYSAVFYFYPRINALNEWTIIAYAADVKPQSALMGWLFNTGPIGRFFEFSLGVLAAQIFLLQKNIVWSAMQYKMLNCLLYVALAIELVFFINPWENSLIGFGNNVAALTAPLLAFILFSSARSSSLFSRITGSKLMVKLGDASYSIYLLHALFLASFSIGPLDKPTWIWAYTVIKAISFIIIMSLITYSFYEKPVQRWLRNKLEKLWQYCINLPSPQLTVNTIAAGFVLTFLFINRPHFSYHLPNNIISLAQTAADHKASRPLSAASR